MGCVLSRRDVQSDNMKIYKGYALFVEVFVGNVKMISFVLNVTLDFNWDNRQFLGSKLLSAIQTAVMG